MRIQRLRARTMAGGLILLLALIGSFDVKTNATASGGERSLGLEQTDAAHIYIPFGIHGVSMLALPIPKTSVPTEAATRTPTPVPT